MAIKTAVLAWTAAGQILVAGARYLCDKFGAWQFAKTQPL